jgi:hypothetical protein
LVTADAERGRLFELLDEQRRDQQLQLALVQEHPQRHDPLLAIPRMARSSQAEVSISSRNTEKMVRICER